MYNIKRFCFVRHLRDAISVMRVAPGLSMKPAIMPLATPCRPRSSVQSCHCLDDRRCVDACHFYSYTRQLPQDGRFRALDGCPCKCTSMSPNNSQIGGSRTLESRLAGHPGSAGIKLKENIHCWYTSWTSSMYKHMFILIAFKFSAILRLMHLSLSLT